MDFDIVSQVSAIDDSFLPIVQPPGSGDTREDRTNDRAWNPGPRSGHWTVSSTVNGSGVDDRTPTLAGFPSRSDYGSVTGTKRIPGGVLRKLALATEAERKEKENAANEAFAESEAIKSEQQDRARSQKAKEGFFAPKLDGMFAMILFQLEYCFSLTALR